MSKLSRQELHSLPGVSQSRDAATKDYMFQQTMLRIQDPQRSLKFYTEVLGMTLLSRFDFEDMKFSLYFLGYTEPEEVPDDPVERARWMFSKPACLELTHNWMTDEEKKELEAKGGYHSGNSDPKGFGHIGISVPSVDEACERFEKLGVDFQKRPQDGKMKFVAFIKDPDGELMASIERCVCCDEKSCRGREREREREVFLNNLLRCFSL